MPDALRSYFNFRHVTRAEGLPLDDNDVNWAIGHLLQRMAARHGIEPMRWLTEKTNPDPSVAAPHCIAHYPLTLFPEARRLVRDWWGDRSRQRDLFD
jgi:hypothetical protein